MVMDLILFSTDDQASMNIFENLSSLVELEEIGQFKNHPYYRYGNFYFVIIEKEKVRAEGIDEEIKEALGINFENIIVASKHRSESGMRSLTVHPIGNYGSADLGGRERMLVKTPSNYMTGALIKLVKLGGGCEYSISYEVTHHGPYLNTPTFFIEIGSNEPEWNDRYAGKLIAETILKMKKTDDEIAIGIGGGHYAPRFTKIAMAKKLSFGHMAPKYSAGKIDLYMLEQMKLKSNAKYVVMEKKDIPGKERKRIEDLLPSLHLELVDPDSLPDRD